MKRLAILMMLALVFSVFSAAALTSSEAKQDWQQAKLASQQAQETHRAARLAKLADPSEENKQAFLDTGKDAMNAALDESEAWLKWKKAEAEEDVLLPSDITSAVIADVDKSLEKIDGLRADVDAIETDGEFIGTFVKMVVGYAEIVTDVARNVGKIWVFKGNEFLDTADTYEAQLRDTAETMDNAAALALLDEARDSLDEARSNVEKADAAYSKVVYPGTPLVKFGEGNNYITTAKMNLISAQQKLAQAYAALTMGGSQ